MLESSAIIRLNINRLEALLQMPADDEQQRRIRQLLKEARAQLSASLIMERQGRR